MWSLSSNVLSTSTRKTTGNRSLMPLLLQCWQNPDDGHCSFTPPEVRPPTIYFWHSKNMIVIGTPLSTAKAAKRPQSWSCSGKKELAPTANVQLLRVCKTIDATGYSDIKPMKDRMNTTAKMGRLIGKRIWTNVSNWEAPSMRADSS